MMFSEKLRPDAKPSALIQQFLDRDHGMTWTREYAVVTKPSGQHIRYWKVICSCGKEFPVRTAYMPRVWSCGCRKNDLIRQAKQTEPGLAGKKILFSRYKNSAKSRDHEFDLTFEELVEITSRDCAYCGTPPIQQTGSYKIPFSVYKHNGIDRVDNERGYTLDNVVACCRDCNFAKHARTKDEFLAWIEQAYHRSVAKT